MVKKITIATLVLLAVQMIGVTDAQAYTPKTGDVIKIDTSAAVFVVDDLGQRVPLSSDAFAIRYNNNFGMIKTVTEAEWGGYTTHFILNRQMSLPDGSLIMYWQNPTIYVLENGFKRGFATWEAFVNAGHSMAKVQLVGDYTLYPTGPVIK